MLSVMWLTRWVPEPGGPSRSYRLLQTTHHPTAPQEEPPSKKKRVDTTVGWSGEGLGGMWLPRRGAEGVAAQLSPGAAQG